MYISINKKYLMTIIILLLSKRQSNVNTILIFFHLLKIKYHGILIHSLYLIIN